MTTEIKSREEIELLVNSFYSSVRKDEVLGPIFESFITDWDAHLEKLYRFWETILLEPFTYKGNPFQPHTKLPISKEHFQRWVEIFVLTVDDNFHGQVAEEAKHRARTMAQIFQSKLSYIHSNRFGTR